MISMTSESSSERTQLVHLLLLTLIGFFVFLVGNMVTARGEEPLTGINFSGDPSSLAELKGLGGGTEAAFTTNQMVARAESIVEVKVVDVQRSYLNTVDGSFPPEAELRQGAFDDLLVLTDVEVEVILDRGRPNALSLDRGKRGRRPVAGKSIVVTVMGGSIQTRLSHGQATALGVMEVVEQFPARGHDSAEAPDIEVERPASGPVDDFAFGVSPAVSLSEDDNLVLMLESMAVPMVGGGEKTVLTLAHSSSVLHEGSSPGEWRVATKNGPIFRPDPKTLALSRFGD